MIIAIVNESGGIEKSYLANNLAASRTQAGRKVLLIDADPKQSSLKWSTRRCAAGVKREFTARAVSGKGLQPVIENLAYRFDDFIIDTEARDCLASRSALMVANIVIILLREGQTNAARQDLLSKHIAMARLYNPGLKVMFVRIFFDPEGVDPAPRMNHCALSTIPSATLATAVIHVSSSLRSAYACGLSVAEYCREGCSEATEFAILYKEVFEDAALRRNDSCRLLRACHRVTLL